MPTHADYRRCAAEGMTTEPSGSAHQLGNRAAALHSQQSTRLKRVVRMISEGAQIKDIAARLKISAQAARQFCWDNDLRPTGLRAQPGAPRRVITPEQILRAIEIKESGLTWVQVGAAIGFSGEAIKVAVSRHRATLALDAALATPEEEEEEGEDDVPEFVAPRQCVVESLMQRLRISRAAAIREAVAYQKARARRETSVGAPVPVTRVPRQPFKLGESSLHVPDIGATLT
jgi:transposase